MQKKMWFTHATPQKTDTRNSPQVKFLSSASRRRFSDFEERWFAYTRTLKHARSSYPST